MSFDYDEQIEKLKTLLNSEEGQALMRKFVEERVKKQEIANGRYRKFEKFLETHDFDEIMQRLIAENGDEWRGKCYKKGYMPHPNNKLAFLIDYVVHNYEPITVDELECEHFPDGIWFIKGYYIQMIWGQGVLTNIFDKNKKFLLQV
jgi:hypothetical protein